MKTILNALQELESNKTVEGLPTELIHALNDARNEALKYKSRFHKDFYIYFTDELLQNYPEIYSYLDMEPAADMENVFQYGVLIDQYNVANQVLDFDISYLI